jgi:hypothetical protein
MGGEVLRLAAGGISWAYLHVKDTSTPRDSKADDSLQAATDLDSQPPLIDLSPVTGWSVFSTACYQPPLLRLRRLESNAVQWGQVVSRLDAVRVLNPPTASRASAATSSCESNAGRGGQGLDYAL